MSRNTVDLGSLTLSLRAVLVCRRWAHDIRHRRTVRPRFRLRRRQQDVHVSLSGILTKKKKKLPSHFITHRLGWLLAFVSSFVSHLVLHTMWPAPTFPVSHADMPATWEYLANAREGLFDDEDWAPGRGVKIRPVKILEDHAKEKIDDPDVFIRSL